MKQQFIEQQARPEIFNLKPYVPGKSIEAVQRELRLTDVVKLASNENALGASPKAQAAVAAALGNMHLYPDGSCHDLKNALAEAWQLSPEHFLVGNGSDELLRLVAETFLRPGDEVIIAQPTFSEYNFVATVMGATTVAVPLKQFRHDVAGMLEAITPATKIMIICNPNNPTGTVINQRAMETLLRSVPPEVLVIFDEAYAEYTTPQYFVSGTNYLDFGPPVLVLRTFSKIFGLAGLRVGYAIGDPELIAAIARVSEPFNVNLLAQVAATAALQDQEHVERSRAMNEAGKAWLYQEFEDLGMRYVDTEANFILVEVNMPTQMVFIQLQKQGVIIRPCDSFGYPRFIRVTVGTPEQNQRFINSLKRMMGL